MFAVKRWPAAWRPMFERGDHVALMLPITPATPPRRSSDCSAASPTSWRTPPRPPPKSPRPFAPSAPTGASINRSRPTHRARLHPRQALIALGPTRRVRQITHLPALRPAEQVHELAPAPRPTAVPQAPLRPLEIADRLTDEASIGRARIEAAGG